MAKPVLQSSAFQFKVVQKPWIENGKPTGFYGNFREDTGACLGVTSEQYGLLQNEELLDTALAALNERGLTGFKQNVTVVGQGERFYASFTFENKTLANSVGDVFGYRLVLRNSFDRSIRAAIALGFLRLACLNGAATLEKEFAVTQKHSSKVTATFIGKAVDAALANGQKALQVYDQLANQAISDEQGQNILRHLELADALSGKIRQSVETLWLAPKRQEDKARNLYNLYNAVTEHLTHQVAKERYEYADKVSTNILLRLVNAARNRATLDKLTAPLPAEALIVVNN
jgi:hypothetical protein